MLGPPGRPGFGGLDPRQAVMVGMTDQAGHPIDIVFGGAREITEAGVRAHCHQHVGKAFDQDAKIGLRAGVPFVLQPASIDAL